MVFARHTMAHALHGLILKSNAADVQHHSADFDDTATKVPCLLIRSPAQDLYT